MSETDCSIGKKKCVQYKDSSHSNELGKRKLKLKFRQDSHASINELIFVLVQDSFKTIQIIHTKSIKIIGVKVNCKNKGDLKHLLILWLR